MVVRRLLAVGTVVMLALVFQRCTGVPTLIDDETAVPDLVRAALLVSDMLSTSGSNAYSRLDVDNSQDATACTDLYNGDNCTSGQREFQFSESSTKGCPLRTGLQVFGRTRLDFTSSLCDDGVDGTIDRTVENHFFQRNTDGKKYLIYTQEGFVGTTYLGVSAMNNFRGERRAGGSRLTIASGTVTLTIDGVHQWSQYNKAYGFHHALYTEGGQSLDIVLNGPDRTVNGFATVSQDRSDIAYTVQFIDVQLNTSCRYPIDGQLVFYQQAAATSGTPVPTATPTHTPSPTVTPTPGGPTPTPSAPTPTPSPTPLHGLSAERIDVTFPGDCGSGEISVNGAAATAVDLLP